MPAPLNLDPKQIADLAEVGCTNVEIARILSCSDKHLETVHKDALEKGRATRKQKLRNKQYQVAMSGNTAMLIFLGKNDLGQSDKHELEHTITPVEIVIAGANWKPDMEIQTQYEELTDGNNEADEEVSPVQRLL